MSEAERQVIVARFDNRSEAQRALKTLNKTLKNQNTALDQGRAGDPRAGWYS